MATLSALPVHPRTWAALLERDDIVLDQGVLRLRHDRTTPDDARTEDLLLDGDRPRSGRSRACSWCGTTCAFPPSSWMSRMPRPRSPRCASCPSRCTSSARRTERSWRPSSTTRLLPPPPSACTVRGSRRAASCATTTRSAPAWSSGVSATSSSRPRTTTPLTRRLTPASDVDFTDVERYGRRWRTIAGMFDVHPAEFTEDVDMVFSWVDGSSSDFQRQRAAQMAEYVVGEGDDGPARYRHVDELRYALRSVHMYAPWVRRIFIATDSPAPAWLLDHPEGDDRAQRGVLRRHLGAADPQLARGRGAAAPHRRARRALPLLERRHVLRSPGRAGAVLLPRRADAVRGVRRPDRRRRHCACTAAATTTRCA